MRHPRLVLLVLTLLSSGALAEVVDKSPSGFLVKSTATVSGAPAQVYRAIVDGVGNWWEKSHTWSGDAKNLSITAKAGGCFCERLPPDGEVQHMTVIFAAPGKMLRMSGALGPMQEAGIAGTLTFELKAVGADTQVTLTYSAGGYYRGGIQALAEPVDQVLGAQLTSLKNYLAR